MEILVLGTSGGMPTKRRNHLALAVRFNGDLTSFMEAADLQLRTEWSARDKATSEHFNY